MLDKYLQHCLSLPEPIHGSVKEFREFRMIVGQEVWCRFRGETSGVDVDLDPVVTECLDVAIIKWPFYKIKYQTL